MPNAHRMSPHSITECVMTVFDELHDPRVLEVLLREGTAAILECRGAAGSLRRRRLPPAVATGVFAKMKKLAGLDVAEHRRTQRARVRILNFHGSPADFEVMTGSVATGQIMTVRRDGPRM